MSPWLVVHNTPINPSLPLLVSSTRNETRTRLTMCEVDHLGIGTQLFQFTTGHEGRTFANGVNHVGTEQAIKNEMAETWKKLRGKEGDEMRAKLARLGRTVTDSWERGEARESMMELGKVIMA
jgi:hypothetical protein